MNKLRLSNLSELNLVIRVYNQTRCNFYNIIGLHALRIIIFLIKKWITFNNGHCCTRTLMSID